MDSTRWQNVTAARHAYNQGSPRAARSPISAFLEVSARCNLRCTMCAINYDQRYKNSAGRPPYLTPDLFARLRPIFPSLLRAYLFGLGEPLLNPHLIDYATELAGHGVEVAFTTNGTLVDEETADRIARAGVSRVNVSIDGARPETYEAIRVGAKFDRVVRGIRALGDAAKRHGTMKLALSFVAMKSNLEDIPLLVDLCAELGAFSLHVEPLLAQVDGTALDDHYARENLGLVDRTHVAAIFDTAAKQAAARGIWFGSRFIHMRDEFDYVKSAPHVPIDWTCSEPWSTIWVTSAGEVRTCCLNDTSFGELDAGDIESIWNGPRYARFREQHARGETATGCANCVRNGRPMNSEFFRPIQPVTYRPYFAVLPPSSPNDPVVITSPSPDATLAEPLWIEGSVHRHFASREDLVMIDYTPIIAVSHDDRRWTRNAFRVLVPTANLTEGAHVLWVRDREGRGYGHRQFHFRRGA